MSLFCPSKQALNTQKAQDSPHNRVGLATCCAVPCLCFDICFPLFYQEFHACERLKRRSFLEEQSFESLPNGGFQKIGGKTQIIQFNRVFHYKSSILGVPLFLVQHPNITPVFGPEKLVGSFMLRTENWPKTPPNPRGFLGMSNQGNGIDHTCSPFLGNHLHRNDLLVDVKQTLNTLSETTRQKFLWT